MRSWFVASKSVLVKNSEPAVTSMETSATRLGALRSHLRANE